MFKRLNTNNHREQHAPTATLIPTGLQDQTKSLIMQVDHVLSTMNRPKKASLKQLIELMPQLDAAYNGYMDALPTIDTAEWEFAIGADDMEHAMDQAGVIQSTQERAQAVQVVLASVAGAIYAEKLATEGLTHAVGVFKNSMNTITALFGLYDTFVQLAVVTSDFAVGAAAFKRPALDEPTLASFQSNMRCNESCGCQRPQGHQRMGHPWLTETIIGCTHG